VLHGLFGLVRRLDPGEHDPGCAQVEGVSCPDAVRGLDPDEHRDAVRVGGELLGQQLALVAAAVLQVGEQPVEPGQSAGLGGQGGAETEERAVQGVTRGQTAGQIGHHGFLPEPRRTWGRWSGRAVPR
jgi:hypothetical protein